MRRFESIPFLSRLQPVPQHLNPFLSTTTRSSALHPVPQHYRNENNPNYATQKPRAMGEPETYRLQTNRDLKSQESTIVSRVQRGAALARRGKYIYTTHACGPWAWEKSRSGKAHGARAARDASILVGEGEGPTLPSRAQQCRAHARRGGLPPACVHGAHR